MTTTVTVKQADALVKAVMKARLVPMLHGSPGTSKSSIVRSIAKQANLKIIDVRMAQCDPCDLNGFPSIEVDEKTGIKTAKYIPMSTFPLEHHPIPEGHTGWLLFLDEFNSAPPAVQGAAYKIVLDREVGEHKLHSRVFIVCAGNKVTDRAIVNRTGTAMQTRLLHFEVEPSWKEWIEWADKNFVDERVTSYINRKPDCLEVFDPNHTDYTYRNQRTWEFLSDVIKDIPSLSRKDLPLIEAAIGQAGAADFIGFTQVYHKLPTIDEIIKNPHLDFNEDEPNLCFAVAGAVGTALDNTNAGQLLTFMERLGVEYQVIGLKKAVRQRPEVQAIPEVVTWISKFATEFLVE